jgi:hypothetical protein
LEDAGYGSFQAFVIGAAASLGEHIGVGNIENAVSGQDAAGNQLTPLERALEARSGLEQLALEAYGLKGLGPAVRSGTKYASKLLREGFEEGVEQFGRLKKLVFGQVDETAVPTAEFPEPKVTFIEGVLDRPRSPAHTKLQQLLAEAAAESGEFKRVGQGSVPLSEFSGLKHVPDIEPDVIAIDHAGRIHMWELRSEWQTMKELKRKLSKAMNQLPPEMRGQIRVIDPETFK